MIVSILSVFIMYSSKLEESMLPRTNVYCAESCIAALFFMLLQ